MKPLVIDASVAAKWVLGGPNEPLQEEAKIILQRHLRGEVRGIVPDLFWPEIVSVLRKAVVGQRMAAAVAIAALAELQQLGLVAVPTAGLVTAALELALHFGHPPYDMVYVALALSLNSELVTADERLVRAVGARLPVRWLGAWKGG